jgi:hypothetical protein
MNEPNPPGHPVGLAWDIETKAKISTSMITRNRDVPEETKERLFVLTLERMKLIQEIRGNTA